MWARGCARSLHQQPQLKFWPKPVITNDEFDWALYGERGQGGQGPPLSKSTIAAQFSSTLQQSLAATTLVNSQLSFRPATVGRCVCRCLSPSVCRVIVERERASSVYQPDDYHLLSDIQSGQWSVVVYLPLSNVNLLLSLPIITCTGAHTCPNCTIITCCVALGLHWREYRSILLSKHLPAHNTFYHVLSTRPSLFIGRRRSRKSHHNWRLSMQLEYGQFANSVNVFCRISSGGNLVSSFLASLKSQFSVVKKAHFEFEAARWNQSTLSMAISLYLFFPFSFTLPLRLFSFSLTGTRNFQFVALSSFYFVFFHLDLPPNR